MNVARSQQLMISIAYDDLDLGKIISDFQAIIMIQIEIISFYILFFAAILSFYKNICARKIDDNWIV